MNNFTAQALAYLKDHWHIGMAGTADAASFLEINPNTLKTRIARDQALVLRGPRGKHRQTLTFTGYHLVYNLLHDRLLRYGFPAGDEEQGVGWLSYIYAEWVADNVLSPPHHLDAILRFTKQVDGQAQNEAYEDGRVEEWTGDAALIIPIGTMVVRIATLVHMRNMTPEMIGELQRQ